MRSYPVSKERMDLFERCLDDGWSFQEIARTHKTSFKFLKKHFDGRQWTPQQRARQGVLVRQIGKIK